MDFGGYSVWVTVSRPVIVDPNTNLHTEGGFLAAFQIGDEPRMIDGEYVKEEGKPKFFQDHNTALCAAFAAAKKKIHGKA